MAIFSLYFHQFFVWLVIGMVTTTIQSLVGRRREHSEVPVHNKHLYIPLFSWSYSYNIIQFETDVWVMFAGGDLRCEMLFTASS